MRQPFRWAAEGESVALPPLAPAPPPNKRGAAANRRNARQRPPRPPPFPVGGVFLHDASTQDDGSPPLRLPTSPPTSVQEMAELEAAYKVLGLWLWLSHRFDAHRFPGRGEVAEAAARICIWLSDGLRATSALSLAGSSLTGSAGGLSAEEDEEEEAQEQEEEDEAAAEGGGRPRPEREASAAAGGAGARAEPTPHEWRALQRRKLMGPWGQWRGVRGGVAYVGDGRGGGGESAAWAPRQQQQPQSSPTAAAHRDDALRFAHPPVPADAAALLAPSGALAGGGGGALAAAALLPARSGAAGSLLPSSASAPLGLSSSASSAAASAHPHAWLIALGDADPLAALMHSSEWDPSMSRYLRPREHGRLVVPRPPPPPS